MKKLILIAACLGFFATNALCQDTKATKSSKTESAAQYNCPKCAASTNKPGQCAHCKMQLVKAGDYYCPGCGASNAKVGQCAHCKKDMVKMEHRG